MTRSYIDYLSRIPDRIMVKIFRIGRDTQFIEYGQNLGLVTKNTYTQTKEEIFNYKAKNHEERARKNAIARGMCDDVEVK